MHFNKLIEIFELFYLELVKTLFLRNIIKTLLDFMKKENYWIFNYKYNIYKLII